MTVMLQSLKQEKQSGMNRKPGEMSICNLVSLVPQSANFVPDHVKTGMSVMKSSFE